MDVADRRRGDAVTALATAAGPNARLAAARRYAERRGLKLVKACGRDAFQLVAWPESGVRVDALAFLREQLAEADAMRFGRYLAAGALEDGHPLAIDEVEAILDAPAERSERGIFLNLPLSYRCNYRRPTSQEAPCR